MMDESLVLLAHLLCLPLHTLVSPRAVEEQTEKVSFLCNQLRVRGNTYLFKEPLTDWQREMLKELQYADEAMYAFFR